MDKVSVGLLCSLIGTILGFIGFLRYYKKDAQEETGSLTKVETKIDYISKGVDDIRLDIKAQDRKIDDIVQRLTRVEESTKSAHHRIDSLKWEE